MRAGIEGDFFVIVEPIEIAPNFTCVEFTGASMRREAATGFERGFTNSDMGGVLVSGVVGIANFGLGFEEPVFELGDAGLAAFGVFKGRTGVLEAFDEAVLPDIGSTHLLLLAAGDEVGIAVIRVGSAAGTTRAIGANDASKPGEVFFVAGADSVVGHEFEVVGVGADGEV